MNFSSSQAFANMIPFGLHVEGLGDAQSDGKSGSPLYLDLEKRVPAKHPLRVIKSIVDGVLVSLDGELEKLYEGRDRQGVQLTEVARGPDHGKTLSSIENLAESLRKYCHDDQTATVRDLVRRRRSERAS